MSHFSPDSPASLDTARLLKVAVFAPLDAPLDYLCDDEDIIQGDMVSVPLGYRTCNGLVISVEHTKPRSGLKAILEKLDAPRITDHTRAFWLWAANYTLTPPGQLIKGALSPLKTPKRATSLALSLNPEAKKPKSTARQRVFAALTEPTTARELCSKAMVSQALIAQMTRDGELISVPLADEPIDQFSASMSASSSFRLNDEQSAALLLMTTGNDQRPVLLDGVTGSGKTEVYLELCAKVLSSDPKACVLILLPEIALTEAVLNRLEARFGVRPLSWHSQVTPRKRRDIFDAVCDGSVRVIVGARSAIFLPFVRLDLIIIDEEHDATYKQEEGIRYQARDLALYRARQMGAKIVLASATPSLESHNHAMSGRFRRIVLEGRYGVARLPDMGLINMKLSPPERDHYLSPPLLGAMNETLERGEQTLLFLNRRGYAPLVLCKACGERMKSPLTDSWLVEHRATGRLVCHLTGYSIKKPSHCPACHEKDTLISIGPGVERILEEVREKFPTARSEIFSSDTTPDALSLMKMVKEIEDGKIDIVVATQAAAKGHNFHNLTLVGIVDADLGLKGGDLRAGERTFQLLSQATGRAGRAEKKGRALIQTYYPDHPVMQTLLKMDRDAFLALEAEQRRIIGFPPFGRLAALIFSAKDPKALKTYCLELASKVPQVAGIEVFGPADAPFFQVRGQFRMRFLVRSERDKNIGRFVNDWCQSHKLPASMRLIFDMDPYSFL